MKNIDFSEKMDSMVSDLRRIYTARYINLITEMMDNLSISKIPFSNVECKLNDKNIRLQYIDRIPGYDDTYTLVLGYFDNIDGRKTIDFGELGLSDMESIVRIAVDNINELKKTVSYTIKFNSEFDIDIPKKDAMTINDAMEWIDKHWYSLIEQNKIKIINKIIYQLTSKKED